MKVFTKNCKGFQSLYLQILFGLALIGVFAPHPINADDSLCIKTDVGFIEDGGNAYEGFLYNPSGVVVEKDGTVYIADTKHHRVRKIQNGQISTVAGTGVPGYNAEAESVPATSAQLNEPSDVALDSQGNIYISDKANHCIRKVNTDGIISTYAGTGTEGDSGDGDYADSAQLRYPSGIAIDNEDNLYIADTENHRIRVVYSSNKRIFPFAGNGVPGFSGDGANALSAQLQKPNGVFVDNQHSCIWIADSGNHRVRMVDTFVHSIDTIVGIEEPGYSGDGNDAYQAQLNYPTRIALDSNGHLYISDSRNDVIRKVIGADRNGGISTYAGGGVDIIDGKPATENKLFYPQGLAVDTENNLYFVDRNNLCRKILYPSTTIVTIAGNKSNSPTPKLSTSLYTPGDICFDTQGNKYVADTYNYKVLKIDFAGVVSVIAGNGEKGSGKDGNDGNGNNAILARLNNPMSVLVSNDGKYLYISEPDSHWIRVVDLTKDEPTINIFAGNGEIGFPKEHLSATATSIKYPVGLCSDSKYGNIYFADRDNNCVFMINMSMGNIVKIAGTGVADKSPDGTIAVNAALNKPVDIWIDRFGQVFIADSGNHRVCMIDAYGNLKTVLQNINSPQGISGNIKYLVVTDYLEHLIYRLNINAIHLNCPCNAEDYIVAGTPNTDGGLSGEKEPAILSRLDSPLGIVINDTDDIYFADSMNHRIRLLSPDCGEPANKIITIAGLFNLEGQALHTAIRESSGVTTDFNGNVYFSDSKNHRVVKIDTDGNIKAIAGNGTAGYSGDQENATNAQLNSPHGIDFEDGILYIADKGNHAVRMVDQNGKISTLVGNGYPGICHCPEFDLSKSCLNEPADVVMKSNGELYISDSNNHRIVKLSSNSLQIVANNDGVSGSDGDTFNAPSAHLKKPLGITFDRYDNLYIADKEDNRIRIIYNIDQTIDTYAGTGNSDPLIENADANKSNISGPSDVAVDSLGDVFVADTGHNRVLRISSYKVTTFAGNNSNDCSAENANATLSCLNIPLSIDFDNNNNLYIADQCNRIVQIDINKNFQRIAGNKERGFSGDNGPSLLASLNSPYDMAIDNWENLYIADKDNHRVRHVSFSGDITTIAGNGTPDFSGDGQPATYASLNSPHDVAVNIDGDVFIADTNNHRIRVIWHDSTIIETFAGGGDKNEGIATFVALNYPTGLAIDRSGDIYIADSGNRKIRKVNFKERTLITISDSSILGIPYDVAIDQQRNIYVSDIIKHQVFIIAPDNSVQPYAGNGSNDYSYVEEYKPAISASLYTPTCIALDDASNLYIVDTGHHRIRKVIESSRNIVTIAGNGRAGFSKEDENPIFASLNKPHGIAIGTNRNVFVADTGNNYIRKLLFEGVPGDWTVDTSQYAYYKKFHGVFYLRDNYISKPGDKIAIFYNGECRGVESAIRTTNGIQFFVRVWGNGNETQNMTIKYYRISDNTVYDIDQTITFSPPFQTEEGTLYEPVRFDLKHIPSCDEKIRICESKLYQCEFDKSICNDNLDQCVIYRDRYRNERDICYVDKSECENDKAVCEDNLFACNNENFILKEIIASQAITITHLVDQYTHYTVTLPEGWHILSSLNTEDDPRDIVLKTVSKKCIAGMFEYKNGSYKPITFDTMGNNEWQQAIISTRNGFWLKASEECTIVVEDLFWK